MRIALGLTLLICAACGDNKSAADMPDAAVPMPDAGFVAEQMDTKRLSFISWTP